MKVSRREMLGAGGLVAVAGMVRVAEAAPVVPVTLVDSGLGPDELKRVQALAGTATHRLEADVVRQWRDELGDLVRLRGTATAYARWDKALLLAGLAREAGIRTAQRRLGRSLFQIQLG